MRLVSIQIIETKVNMPSHHKGSTGPLFRGDMGDPIPPKNPLRRDRYLPSSGTARQIEPRRGGARRADASANVNTSRTSPISVVPGHLGSSRDQLITAVSLPNLCSDINYRA